ncbi:MAG TPA: PQQ-binding-like beta-propeller repeat protein [Rhizomicrobium sp.]|jgi:quinoprotein glucose dehydrogenase
MFLIKKFALLSASWAALSLSSAVSFGADKDWVTVGGDATQSKYSTLGQITPANVGRLAKSWSYPAGGTELTPIVIDSVMYFPAGTTVYALDAVTGKELWKVDLNALVSYAPELAENPARAAGLPAGGRGAPPPPEPAKSSFLKLGGSAKYGVAYYAGNGKIAPRIVVTTGSGYIVQLDAKTGTLFKKFGVNGALDLRLNVMEKMRYSDYRPGMLATVYRNLAIIAPRTGENGRYGPPGDARAFDLNTGKEVWRFHTIPHPGESNFGTWGPHGWQDRRGPGSWVPMSVDQANGLVFMAVGNATDQNYGGARPGDNLYATSLVAIDATNGKVRWHFQTTHHDIYDWDLNGAPALIDMRDKNGKPVAAVAQSTKQGYLFVLDRLTGKPVLPVEERPVSESDAPGEFTAPTQPVPVNPDLTIARVSLTREEVGGLTPEAHRACLALYDKVYSTGEGVPYSRVPTLVFPGTTGGATFAGAAFDPALNYIVINTKNAGQIAMITPQLSAGTFESMGKSKISFVDPQGEPCTPAPWGELMAIDAATGNKVWRETLGERKDLVARGIANPGTENRGGPIVTRGGVLFIGATLDKTFRAFDPKTGKLLWSGDLSADNSSTPFTYQGKDGHQYVGVTEGGSSGAPRGETIVFSLP